ncbi:helix-turn-helix transcriptional regulator [Algiphilus sp.]|uniref:helix-turn-helix domain-containing protein n=1 Tax=Algiphilus sp. TaxID=1872431 RepID=UPI00345233EE|nr:helix-turn-helix transcriptional regulator [Algiphilus sp.]
MTDSPTTRRGGFCHHLRHWRAVRGFSQARLAEAAGLSVKHINFLENGRAQPSSAITAAIADALDLSLKNANALMRAAGFSPIYRQRPLSSPELNR